MSKSTECPQFRVMGPDQTVFGPVELPELVRWVRDGRVRAESWVYQEQGDTWKKAARMVELQMFFVSARQPVSPGLAPVESLAPSAIEPGLLHRVRILADLSHGQLERLQDYVEVMRLPMNSMVVKHGTPGDGLFMILEGELRVSLIVTGSEKLLTLLGPGEFFGELSVFDRGVRSADVIANSACLLVKLTNEALERLTTDAPDVAAPLLLSMAKTLAARIRADNRRYGNVLAFGEALGGASASASHRA